MRRTRLIKLLIFILILSLSMWTMAGCGKESGDDGGDKADKASEFYTNAEVNSELSIADDVAAYYEAVGENLEYAYKLAYKLAYNEDLSGHLGWRLAGSKEEHACADFLTEEMEAIGLKDVKKIGTPCDSFQFNDSSLIIEGTNIKLQPASYQLNGTGPDGLTAEIVDVGTGFEADYEGKDVKGKIVLAQVDQANEAWIDVYIDEAYQHGAAALVSYANSGYGELNKDTINVQDVCCADLIPTAAISFNQAKDIKAAIKSGKKQCTLMLDAVMKPGTTYNVVGKIPGKSSDQQIIVSAHYDKYWYGFQDDCAAVGLVFGVAKSMLESGYQPENDILFICHGAEEWGLTGTMFDWTVGAWGLIEANPDWSGKTIAMLNCELPAFTPDSGATGICNVPEFRTLSEKLINETGLVVTKGKSALTRESSDSTTMEDGISYRWHGVPYFVNYFEDAAFISQRYHTSEDNKDTYDAEVYQTNINWNGALAMYIDTMPALELDLSQAGKDLKKGFDEKLAKEAGVDIDAYYAAITEFNKAAKAHNKKIADCNAAYEEAVAAEDKEAAAALREEGKALNKTSLTIFREIQDRFMKNDDFRVYYGHFGIADNANILKGTIEGLEAENYWGDDGDGACDYIYNLNAVHEYNYYNFSYENAHNSTYMYDPNTLTKAKGIWGYQKQIPIVDVGKTTYDLFNAVDAEDPDFDYEGAKKTYEEAYKKCLTDISEYAAKEISDLGLLVKLFK